MASFVNEKEFPIHVVCDWLGNSALVAKTYTGDFVAYKFLSARLILLKDQILRKNLAGENPLISGQVDLASKLAVIQSSLKEGPEWWKEKDCLQGDALIDMNVIDEVYNKVNDIQLAAEQLVLSAAGAAAVDLPGAAAKQAEKEPEPK